MFVLTHGARKHNTAALFIQCGDISITVPRFFKKLMAFQAKLPTAFLKNTYLTEIYGPLSFKTWNRGCHVSS